MADSMVLYTGIGANESGVHTVYELVGIMWRYFGDNPDIIHCRTLADWLDFSGAVLLPRRQCQARLARRRC